MNSKRINQLIAFLKEIEKLKLIERQTYLSSFRRENDAEHSWHVAMFIILFEKDFPGFNTAKMLKMALVHDLVEIYAGDTFSFDSEARKNKKEKEEKAAKKLFCRLPTNLRKDFIDLFNEYENRQSKEAKLVQSFDKMQPILQGIVSKGKMWKERGISYKHIDDYKREYVIENNKVMKIYDILLKEAKRKKLV
jgi:putative hydrolase of HD superfamily